jgi:hypothetical protein
MKIAIAFAVVLAGCYGPQLERCAVRCTQGGDACPLEMTCGGDGHCHTADDKVACPVDKFQVTVMPAGGGTGVVTAMPQINCPSSCTETVDDGTKITLSATAAGGSRFAGWGGPCTGVDPCMLVVDGNKTVGANFVLTQPLTIEIQGPGPGHVYTTAPPDLMFMCSDSTTPCTTQYDAGASVTLMAQPDGASTSVTWDGACNGFTGDTCTVTLSQPVTAIAYFN